MSKVYSLLVLCFSAVLVSCGGGGGSGGGGPIAPQPPKPVPVPVEKPTGAQIFSRDMQQLVLTKIDGVGVDAKEKGVFSKLFGGPTSQDVVNFINVRSQNVHGDKEIANFELEVYEKGEFLGADAFKNIFDIFEDEDDAEAKSFTVGVNYGTMLFNIQQETDYTFKLRAPKGLVSFDSPRAGLIGLTSMYGVIPTTTGEITVPLEGRVGTLVHEGRHSDCPVAKGEDGLCGYGHQKCWEGHSLAGEFACDQRPYGSYGVEAIYLMSVANNYPLNSLNGQIMQFLADDIVGRVSEADWELMKQQDPDLNSI